MDRGLLRRRDVHLGAAGTDGTDGRHDPLKLGLFGREVECPGVLRIRSQHDGVSFMGQGLPDLLREEGHEGVEQLQHAIHAVDENGFRGLGALAAFLETDLGDLDVPVAEQVPDEVV